jgi:hypothetical protein
MIEPQLQDSNQYNEMVTKALERLIRWAYPDSQVERKDPVKWQLWHNNVNNQKYIDVSVEIQIKHGKPSQFFISDAANPRLAGLSREQLDDALRIAICSLS